MGSMSKDSLIGWGWTSNVGELVAHADHDRKSLGTVDIILSLACLVFLMHGIFYLLIGMSRPLLDFHSFRQTQTALTAYWLWRGGPWFVYETPFLGSPWSIPIEFPIYQYLVALLKRAGVSIEAGGRLISYAFYIACLWPLWIIFKQLNFPRISVLIVSALFLSSPIYLYWSRTVMIETCALFFSLFWLALLVQYLKQEKPAHLVAALLAGSIGVLVKSTTFPGFALLGGLAIFAYACAAWRANRLKSHLIPLSAAIIITIIPFGVGLAWGVWSDSIRQDNAFGALLTTRQLVEFVVGDWAARFSPKFWWDVALLRMMPDIFGYAWVVAGLAFGVGAFTRRYAFFVLALAAAFVAPLMVFTLGHATHRYYQTANGIFALTAVGLGLSALWYLGQRALAALLLVALLVGQIYFFHVRFVPVIATDASSARPSARIFRIAGLAREQTQPTESLLVIGNDLSSAAPYFSERKALVLPNRTPRPLMERLFEDPQSFLGASRLGAIIYCSAQLQNYGDRVSIIEQFIANRVVLGQVGECQLLAPISNAKTNVH